MLINYALTGVFGEDDFPKKNDYKFKGKNACSIWILLKGGKIDRVEGIDEIKSHENVAFVVERFKIGDVVLEEFIGTERQIIYRIYVNADSIIEVNQIVENFKNTLQVFDSNGENMILEWLKPWNIEDYK